MALAATGSCVSSPGDRRTAPLLEDLGTFHYPVTVQLRERRVAPPPAPLIPGAARATSDPFEPVENEPEPDPEPEPDAITPPDPTLTRAEEELVQRLFDQGMVLSYAAQHEEAERSFREAARVSPECGMCWWGAALAAGPQLDGSDATRRALEALEQARALRDDMAPKERSLIDTLSARYSTESTDRVALDQAYVHALAELMTIFPEDLEIAALYAEALLILQAGDYWQEDGTPHARTARILEVLDSLLSRDPSHILANRLRLDLMESSTRPELAQAAAERLGTLAPGVPHLLHLPSHVFLATGRYHDATETNLRAGEAERAYVEQCARQGVAALPLNPHAPLLLWVSACLEGRSAVAKAAAQETAARATHAVRCREAAAGETDLFLCLPYLDDVRFGRWDRLLATPPPAGTPGPLHEALWHYAQGAAHASRNALTAAGNHLAQLRRLVTSHELHSAASAADLLEADIATNDERYDDAVAALKRAVEREKALHAREPLSWYFPARRHLGNVLLQHAQNLTEAEAVYRDDLESHPENGWALKGLTLTLEMQKEDDEAAAARARFEAAWQWADVELDISRF